MQYVYINGIEQKFMFDVSAVFFSCLGLLNENLAFEYSKVLF